MARIRSTGNTTTELRLAELMRKAGIAGWRRHYPLLGKPDFAFPKSRLAVFVDGCFWHGHACGRNLRPRRNEKAWQEKICGNRRRDQRIVRALRAEGWWVVRLWECVLAKRPELCIDRIVKALRVE